MARSGSRTFLGNNGIDRINEEMRRIMLIITIQVNAPTGQAIGIKEAVAMDLEKYGGQVRVVSVEEIRPEQMKIQSRSTPVQ